MRLYTFLFYIPNIYFINNNNKRYYGFLQAEVVKYKSVNGEKLEREWFLQTLEASANVLLGLFGLYILEGGPSQLIPWKGFAISGSTQVYNNIHVEVVVNQYMFSLYISEKRERTSDSPV